MERRKVKDGKKWRREHFNYLVIVRSVGHHDLKRFRETKKMNFAVINTTWKQRKRRKRETNKMKTIINKAKHLILEISIISIMEYNSYFEPFIRFSLFAMNIPNATLSRVLCSCRQDFNKTCKIEFKARTRGKWKNKLVKKEKRNQLFINAI
jgi:hypothetical protein